MRIKITFFLFIGFVFFGFGQNKNSRDNSYYESFNIGVGYSYNYGEPNNKNFHLLDIGINKTSYGGIHGGGFGYGFGTDIALNTKNFVIGPKISGVMYFQFVAFGAELITYTDFNNYTLRFVPFIGIGIDKFKLTINPHIILTNKNFQPINKGLVNLTINLSLSREKVTNDKSN